MLHLLKSYINTSKKVIFSYDFITDQLLECDDDIPKIFACVLFDYDINKSLNSIEIYL